jgi:ubiquinone/menaquinone biosynthesis C-methylase UbiE
MAKVEPFETFSDVYDAWFVRNADKHALELAALKCFLPVDRKNQIGLEIGVGSGQFAAPLHVPIGLEPAAAMAKKAVRRGITVVRGCAEHVPFFDSVIDYVILVTTICFVDDIHQTFAEVYRILKPAGRIIVGFVDKHSSLGRRYRQYKHESRFYRSATFFTAQEVLNELRRAGFANLTSKQTLFPKRATNPTCGLKQKQAIQTITDGFGQGAFVVLTGTKSRTPFRTNAKILKT